MKMWQNFMAVLSFSHLCRGCFGTELDDFLPQPGRLLHLFTKHFPICLPFWMPIQRSSRWTAYHHHLVTIIIIISAYHHHLVIMSQRPLIISHHAHERLYEYWFKKPVDGIIMSPYHNIIIPPYFPHQSLSECWPNKPIDGKVQWGIHQLQKVHHIQQVEVPWKTHYSIIILLLYQREMFSRWIKLSYN